MPPPNRKYRQPAKTGPDTSTWSAEEVAAHLKATQLKTPVAELGLPVRIVNTLEEYDVILVEDLVKQTYESLMGMKNFGEKTLRVVEKAIGDLGLEAPKWKKPPEPPKPPKGGMTMLPGIWG